VEKSGAAYASKVHAGFVTASQFGTITMAPGSRSKNSEKYRALQSDGEALSAGGVHAILN
jgi:hypothetical protein